MATGFGEDEMDGELSIFVSVEDGKITYAIFSGENVIYVDEAQAAILSYALRGMLRACSEMPNEVVN